MPNRQTIGELLGAARAGPQRLDPIAAHQAHLDGALLIDTRSADVRRETGGSCRQRRVGPVDRDEGLSAPGGQLLP